MASKKERRERALLKQQKQTQDQSSPMKPAVPYQRPPTSVEPVPQENPEANIEAGTEAKPETKPIIAEDSEPKQLPETVAQERSEESIPEEPESENQAKPEDLPEVETEVENKSQRVEATGEFSRGKQPKNIIICSDGTGNRGGWLTPSNVWRVYQAVDETPEGGPQQVRLHGDGVGNHSFKFFKILGGAFGWGISRNLRDLYEALIHAHEEGDRIFLFGFSRGAYTVRILAQMICMFGIPSPKGKTPEEIHNMAKLALDMYKKANDEMSSGQHNVITERGVASQKNYNSEAIKSQSETVKQVRNKEWNDCSNSDYPVHFLGCWDTVDAVGLPFDEMTQAFHRLFPLRFRSSILNAGVHHAVHALALDDERHTFHPLLWTPVAPSTDPNSQTIEQVWFPGAHSNVGGGYPKDELALVSLVWMLKKAQTHGLKVHQSLMTSYEQEASAHGTIYDSRAGLGAYYRYRPRRVDQLIQNIKEGGTPDEVVIHSSVVERIVEGTAGYTPTAIMVSQFSVVGDIEGQPPAEMKKRFEQEDLARLTALEEAHDYIWMNRVLYFLFVGWTILFFLFGAGAGQGLMKSGPMSLLLWPFAKFQMIIPIEELILTVAVGILPGIIGDLLLGFDQIPGLLFFMLICLGFLFWLKGSLLNLIAESALNGWARYRRNKVAAEAEMEEIRKQAAQATAKTKVVLSIRKRFRLRQAAWRKCRNPVCRIRNQKFLKKVEGVWRNTLAPALGGIAIILLLILAFVLIIPVASKPFWFRWNNPKENLTLKPAVMVTEKPEGNQVKFPISEPYFATSYQIEKGKEYTITVYPTEERNFGNYDWKDERFKAGPEGLDHHAENENTARPSLLRYAQRNWKRVPKQPIFKLMAGIGPIHEEHFIPIGESATFTAPESGRLHLFVNDVPGYYGNNQGTAYVTIKREKSAAK